MVIFEDFSISLNCHPDLRGARRAGDGQDVLREQPEREPDARVQPAPARLGEPRAGLRPAGRAVAEGGRPHRPAQRPHLVAAGRDQGTDSPSVEFS